VGSVLASPPRASYDVLYQDPPDPLPDAEVDADLAALVAQGWLTADALVVVERASKRSTTTWPEGITPTRERKYGETMLRYGHAASPDGDQDADQGE
jgi:16S rRNA (guanine966-N2)-methyltransferase